VRSGPPSARGPSAANRAAAAPFPHTPFPHKIRACSDLLRADVGNSRAVETFGKTLLVFAVVLAFVGGVVLLFPRLGMSRLPGDIVVRGKHVTFFFPLGCRSCSAWS
jgi:Protein of unknown function (DUF2905)